MDAQGPVAILWDIENCAIPSDVQPADVAINIRKALGGGAVTTFSAYGDFSSFPRTVREGCQRTGVKLVDVPNGRKDAADKAILVDMFLFALDNRPPSSVVLISGDVDFSQALHILGQRGYTIILVIPSGVRVSPVLRNAGQFVWDWPSVARGVSSIPSTRPSVLTSRMGSNEISNRPMGCQSSENQDALKNEEAFGHHTLSRSYHNSKDMSFSSQSLSKNASVASLDLPCSTSTEVSSGSLTFSLSKATPGSLTSQSDASCLQKQSEDLNGLKARLVQVLEQSGGCLAVSQISLHYQKLFDQPLCVSNFGATNLVKLLQKFSDVMPIEGEGPKQIVYLRKFQGCATNDKSLHSPVLSKDRGIQFIMNEGLLSVSGSTDQLSDDYKIIVENNSLGTKEEKDSVTTQGGVGEASGADCNVPISCKNPTRVSKALWPASYVLGYGASKVGYFLQKLSNVNPINNQDEGNAIHLKYEDVHLVSGSSDELSEDKRAAAKDVSSVEKREEKTNFQLKGHLVKLLEHFGGSLALSNILPEYQRFFDQPLHISDHGACELVNLLQNFSDVLSVVGEDSKEIVYLKNFRAGATKDVAHLSSPFKDERGKEGQEIQNVNDDSHLLSPPRDEYVALQEDSVEEQSKEMTLFHLKAQLVKLLEQYEGCLALAQIPPEYQKFFGRPLCVLDNGDFNLISLLQKFSDVMAIEGEDAKKFVYLRTLHASLNTVEKWTGPGTVIPNANEDAHLVSGSSDELSDNNKRALPEEDSIEKKRQRMNMFKVMTQLMKLLAQSGGCLAFNKISVEYKKLFGQQLCVSEYGACKLVDLLKEFSCVMTIEGEDSERKVYLRDYPGGITNVTPVASMSKDKEGTGKRIQKNANENSLLVAKSPEDKMVVVEENLTDEKGQRKAIFRVRGQLIKLLEQFGGCLAFNLIAQEYNKHFGRNLCVSEYGASKLVDLLHQFSHVMTVEGDGLERLVYLKNCRAGTANATVLGKGKVVSGKGIKNANKDADMVSGSSDEKRVALEKNQIDEKCQRKAMFRLRGRLRGELIKLLEQSAGCVALVHISSEYEKFYGRPLCVSEYGACKIADLLENFSSVMTIEGEGKKRLVYLKNYRAVTANGTVLPSPLLSEGKKGTGIPSVNEIGNSEKNSLKTDKAIIQLKMQVVELLKQSGGCMDLSLFRGGYQQRFGQPLCIAEYGASKLMDLLLKFSDVLSIKGEGPLKLACLKNYRAGTANDTLLPSSSLSGNCKGSQLYRVKIQN